MYDFIQKTPQIFAAFIIMLNCLTPYFGEHQRLVLLFRL